METCIGNMCTAPVSNETHNLADYYGPSANEAQNSTEYYDYSNMSLVYLDEDESQKFGGMFSGVFYLMIFGFSVAGNALLIWAVLKHENLHKPTNVLLLNLTASDLLFTFTLPFWATYQLHQWVFGELACKLVSGAFFLGLYSYMTFLAGITVHRYVSVVHAVSSLRAGRPHCTILASALAWFLCAAASLPDTLFSATRESHDGTMCEATPWPLHFKLIEYYLQIILFFLTPFAIITFCYTRMWATVWKCRSRKKHQVTKLIFCIILVFFFCWAPYNVVLFLFSLQSLDVPLLVGPGWTETLNYSYYICHTLAICHCCVNPFFHIFGSGKFRSHVLKGHHFVGHLRRRTSSEQNGSGRASGSHQTFV